VEIQQKKNLDEKKEKEYYSSDVACNAEKDVHEKCFFVWYEKFLKGNVMVMECESEWQVYQECLKKKLKAHELSEYLEPQRRIFFGDEQPKK